MICFFFNNPKVYGRKVLLYFPAYKTYISQPDRKTGDKTLFFARIKIPIIIHQDLRMYIFVRN